MSGALRKPAVFDGRLTEADLRFFQQALERRCGVALPGTKGSLVESRLRRRVESLGLASFAEYREHLRAQGPEAPEWQAIVNALTTHTTEWFREPDHFRQLRELALAWRAAPRGRAFRVWSAACSSGEEPYSIALVLEQLRREAGLEYEVLAGDVDTNVLEKGRRGRYPAEDLERIPAELRSGALALGTGAAEGWLKVRPHVRERVRFEPLNLARLPYEAAEPFDVVFCRNVFIYFPPEFIERVAKGLFEVTRPGGTLFIGHSESFSGLEVPWRYQRPAAYRKPEGR